MRTFILVQFSVAWFGILDIPAVLLCCGLLYEVVPPLWIKAGAQPWSFNANFVPETYMELMT